jgi:hypothetical protein
MPDDEWGYECIDFTREPIILYKAKKLVKHELINYNLPTHTILNKLNDDTSIKHIFNFVGTKPKMFSCFSDGEYNGNSQTLEKLKSCINYKFNINNHDKVEYIDTYNSKTNYS